MKKAQITRNKVETTFLVNIRKREERGWWSNCFSFLSLLWLSLFFPLRCLLLDRGLAGLLDLDWLLVLCLRLVLSRRSNAEHTVRRQARWHLIDVALFGYQVLAHKLPWDSTVFVLLLLVLGFYHHAVIHNLNIDLLRLELLHVQDHLELVRLDGRRATLVLAQQFTPRSIVKPRVWSYDHVAALWSALACSGLSIDSDTCPSQNSGRRADVDGSSLPTSQRTISAPETLYYICYLLQQKVFSQINLQMYKCSSSDYRQVESLAFGFASRTIASRLLLLPVAYLRYVFIAVAPSKK